MHIRSRNRNRSRYGGDFFPGRLFLSGAQGAWYDPSDLSTLYQTSTGTTPVTAVEQPVGLMLDRSRGLVLGSELVTNGAFDTDTGWTLGSGWAVSGGQATFTANGTNSAITRVANAAAVSGRTYEITFDIVANTLNAGAFRIGAFSGNSYFSALVQLAANTTLPGTYKVLAVSAPSGTGTVLDFWVSSAATSGSLTIDNISVRELPGNHAFQSSSASRPILRSRYNLLLRTETMITSPWFSGSGYNSTITNGTIIAPNDTVTGSTLASDTGGGTGVCMLAWVSTLVANTPYTFSFFVRANTLSWIRLFALNHGNNGGAYFDVANGALGTIDSGYSATVTPAANQYYRCSITFTPSLAGPGELRLLLANSNGNTSVARDGTKSVYIWGAQLLTAADHAATGGAYQRVGAATDYDTGPPWRPYLAFDGSDDSMATSSIDFSGTDKMTVFAGVSKLSDAAAGVVLGHGADFSVVGAFEWQSNTGANATTAFRGRSSAGSTANAGFTRNVVAPSTFVFAVLVDYAAAAGAEFSGRYDGVVQVQNDGLLQENTGTFGNNVLTIGSRQGGASQRFNGRLYALTVLGRTATAAEIAATEQWIAGKTGVVLP